MSSSNRDMTAYLLLSANLVVGIPWILSTIIAVATRIEREEAMMIEQFSDEYRIYGSYKSISPHTEAKMMKSLECWITSCRSPVRVLRYSTDVVRK